MTKCKNCNRELNLPEGAIYCLSKCQEEDNQ